MCTYAAHHQGIAIVTDRCREQMKLPVDQIDSCGHLRVHEKSALTKFGVRSITIDRGSKTHQKSEKNHCRSTILVIFSVDFTMKLPFPDEICHSKHAFIQDISFKTTDVCDEPNSLHGQQHFRDTSSELLTFLRAEV